jgi:purine-binding chemotaxis protein CheW
MAATTQRDQPVRPPAGSETSGVPVSGTIQVVEFLLGKEHFAVDLFDVREVVEYTRITELPSSPPHIRGIIDLRGEITTIVDIKKQMNIREDSVRDEANSRIIVLDNMITRSKIGIMVDDVLTVSTFSRSDVDSTSASGIDDSLIVGIIRKKMKIRDSMSTELVIWIDIRKLLQDNGQAAAT